MLIFLPRDTQARNAHIFKLTEITHDAWWPESHLFLLCLERHTKYYTYITKLACENMDS